MRAIRHDGTEVILDPHAAVPEPGPGEAIVRPVRLGVTESDVRIQRQEIRFSGVLGNEFVGVVESVNVPSDAPPMLRAKAGLAGERVVGSPTVVCSSCEMCRKGMSAHCSHRRVLGVSGADGCFADSFAIPLVNLHPVPEGVDDDHAVMAGPLAQALHSARLAGIDGPSFVTVLGDSHLALLTAQAMTLLNASVRLLGDHPERVSLCERWGVKHRMTEEVGRRQDQDIVVDCTGGSDGLRLAMQLVRPRGTIVMKSPTLSAPFPPGQPFPAEPGPDWAHPVDLRPAIANEIRLYGSRDGAFPDALGLLESGRVDVVSLITRTLRLDDGPDAIRAATDPEQVKVLIAP